MADDKVADMQTEVLKEQIRQFEKQFEELDRLNVRTIPENMFVHHFLPFFAGEVKENAQEIMTNWLTIAGSAVSPVNVVNTAGQVVAQVPPVQNNAGLDPTAQSDANIAYSAKEAKAMMGLSPIAAQNILSSELGVKLSAMTKNIAVSNADHEKRWDTLLGHYGKKTTGSKENTAVQEDAGDIFGF
jgi:hypothetical protein